jgi:hypothetical protein
VPRSYSVTATALAVGSPYKWIDNLLSRYDIAGVTGGRQGVERTISDEGLLRIELVRIASVELGLSVARAVEITRALDPSSSSFRYRGKSGTEISFPLREIADHLRARILDAIEAAPRVPRGRPRRHAAT